MPRYVAIQPIRHGWALAFSPGDPVHEDNVAAYGYLDDGLVEEVPDDALVRPELTGSEASATHTDTDDENAEQAAAKPSGKGK